MRHLTSPLGLRVNASVTRLKGLNISCKSRFFLRSAHPLCVISGDWHLLALRPSRREGDVSHRINIAAVKPVEMAARSMQSAGNNVVVAHVAVSVDFASVGVAVQDLGVCRVIHDIVLDFSLASHVSVGIPDDTLITQELGCHSFAFTEP